MNFVRTFGYYPVKNFLFSQVDILGAVKSVKAMGSLERSRGVSRRKVVVALLGALLFTQFAKTMAADLIPADPSIIVTPSDSPVVAPTDSAPPAPPVPTDSPSVPPVQLAPPAPSTAPAPSDSPVAPAPVVSAPTTSSPSASPTPPPPHALANQTLVVQVPNQISVDPRARTVLLPPIAAYGTTYLLACANSAQVAFAVQYPNTGAPVKGQPQVAGAGSTNLRVSGTAAQVLSILNSPSGMRLYSTGPSIANQSIFFNFIALSEPSINPALCGAGSVSNSRTTGFHPLGLAVDMASGNVTLKH